jgi:hypothetical protein
MNLVDMLKDQLTGEVGKKLGGMMGASDSDMGKLLGAGLPSVLSGLGSLAGSKSGADKLASALGGMDSSSFGNMGKMLGGNALSGGGSMLSGLLGGSVMDGVANAIAKFTGINVTMVKMGLGYLTPLVLGSVGASFKGAKPDAAGISKLFSEQKSNIASAMPPGFSLDSVPGFNALASNVSSQVANSSKAVAEKASGGIGKLLIPVALLAALLLGGYFIMNQGAKNNEIAVKVPASTPTTSSMDRSGSAPTTPFSTVGAESLLSSLASKLEGITDVASAESAMTGLNETVSGMDALTTSMPSLDPAGRSKINALVKGILEKIAPMLDRINAIPGIGDALKGVLDQLKEKLTTLTGV